MPSDRQPRVTPVVTVRRMFAWECPNEHCRLVNHEAEFTLYDASSFGKRAKGKCVRCEQEVELTL